MLFKSKLIWIVAPFYLLAVLDELLYTEAYMKSVRIEEIPFALTLRAHNHSRESSLKRPQEEPRRSIHALKRLDQHKGFLKIFNVPSGTANPLNVDVIDGSPQRCQCAHLVSTESPVPVVYFDRDHIGNISTETIRNTIEFLENFLPPPPKKNKRKNRVRSRLDEIDIE